MKTCYTFLFCLLLIPFFLNAQSASLIPGRLQINGQVPPASGTNIDFRSDNSGNNFLTVGAGNNGSSYFTLNKGNSNIGSAYVTYGGFTTSNFTSFAAWNAGIGGSIFAERNDYEVVLTGSSNLSLNFLSPLSISAETLGTTLSSTTGTTLTLERGTNPASLLIKSFENGFAGNNDYAGFQWSPNGDGTELNLFATSFDNTGGFPISSIATVGTFKSNGNFAPTGDIEFGIIEVGNLGSSNLGIDADIVPYSGNAGWDLGNNVNGERWDDVVADDFINASDRRLKKQIHALHYGLDAIMQLKPVQYKYLDDHDSEKDHLGLIAQEVLDIIPEVVATHDVDADSTGRLVRTKNEYLGLNYVALVPVLIQSIQEQQTEIEELRAEKADLESRLARIEEHLGLETQEEDETIILTGEKPQLEQNVPNPATDQAAISYYLPQDVSRAELRLFDQSGRLLQQTALNNQPGQRTVRLKLQQLPAATYTYSLFVDGQVVASRKLVVR
jgi:hypothetical protein